MYATELGDAGTDVMDFLKGAQDVAKRVTDIATDPFSATQSQPGTGKNTGILPPDFDTQSTTPTDEAVDTTTSTLPKNTTSTTESSDLDVGGFLKRNFTPRPLPSVVAVSVGSFTYYKTGKVLRSVLFGVGSMFVSNFIQERVEMSKAGGN